MSDSKLKKLTKLLAFAGLIALSGLGCVSYHTPPMDRRVTVSPDLGTAVWVTDVRFTRIQSQQWTVQANVVNNTNAVVPMEYRVVWLDANGMELPGVMSTWLPISAAPREVIGLSATAPAPQALDFRFYVQAKRP